jgi:hypothetical protein
VYEVNSLDVPVTCQDAPKSMIHSNNLVGDLETRACAVYVDVSSVIFFFPPSLVIFCFLFNNSKSSCSS